MSWTLYVAAAFSQWTIVSAGCLFMYLKLQVTSIFFVTNIIWHTAEYLELLDIFYYCFEYFEVAIYDSNIEDTTALNFGSFSWQNSNGNNPNSCNHET